MALVSGRMVEDLISFGAWNQGGPCHQSVESGDLCISKEMATGQPARTCGPNGEASTCRCCRLNKRTKPSNMWEM